MNLKPFTGPGSTPSRRRFWDKVTQAVIASQKVAGHNVTTDEHEGMGTFINVSDSNARRTKPIPQPGPQPPPTDTGACCVDGVCEVRTEAECATAGGTFHGVGTPCTDILCAFCNDCYCSTSGPFDDGIGGFWTTNETNCLGITTYSGPTTFDARYTTFTQIRTCCVGGCVTGAVEVAYGHVSGETCFCDSACTGADCEGNNCPDCLLFNVRQELSGLVDPPC